MLDIPNPESYSGTLLYLKPGYGWGWHCAIGDGEPAPLDHAVIGRAGPFHIRVNRFFAFRNDLRGVVGRIEQEGHFLHGCWLSCADVLGGKHDFTERLSMRYDLSIGPIEPSGEWPLARDCSPIYSGYGILADDENSINRYWDSRGWSRAVKP